MGNADNPRRGASFEGAVQAFFAARGIRLRRNFPVQVGMKTGKRPRKFDLGASAPPVLVECKCHTWTAGRNAPSAKLTAWNEAMLFFSVAPSRYRKILAVMRHMRGRQSLAQHYVGRFGHMIPHGVEIWELDRRGSAGRKVYPDVRAVGAA